MARQLNMEAPIEEEAKGTNKRRLEVDSEEAGSSREAVGSCHALPS